MENTQRTLRQSTSSVSADTDLVTSYQRCGIGWFKPRWIQGMANPKAYLAVFCILGILQGAYFTYFIGIISTLERRYAFHSKISGLILIADNFGPVVGSILIGYFGGQAHRPRLMSAGMTLVVASCFLSALPYFIYGPQVHVELDSDVLHTTEFCDKTMNSEDCLDSKLAISVKPAILIFFLANFLNGFGYIAYYTMGTPYLDDSIAKEDFPLYISVSGAMRIFGPTVGFLLSSLCLRYFEDPQYDPGFSVDNPRWVGAWWVGFIVLGVVLLFFAVLLSLFPRSMPGKSAAHLSTKDKGPAKNYGPKLQDFPKAIKRLIGNPMLVCQTLGFTFYINGYFGYFMFIPKYMEIQYRQSAAASNLISGSSTTISVLLGIVLGGLAIRLIKPLARVLTGSIVVAQLVAVFGLFILLFLGCPSPQFPGTEMSNNHLLNLSNACNSGCHCSQRVFQPVCGPDGTSTYFSPCFAGCTNLGPPSILSTDDPPLPNSSTNYPVLMKGNQVFHDCQCLHDNQTAFAVGSATGGYCGPTCLMFMPYIVILCITMFICSTSRVGSSVITMRCVDPGDKSFAIGGIGSFLALFALLPCPLIFGALMDSACVVWEENCGVSGNCWLYDADKLRYNLNGMAITLVLLGVVFDVAVFFLSDTLGDLYGEQPVRRRVQYVRDEDEEEVIYVREPINSRTKLTEN